MFADPSRRLVVRGALNETPLFDDALLAYLIPQAVPPTAHESNRKRATSQKGTFGHVVKIEGCLVFSIRLTDTLLTVAQG